jgi:hypothetical protein
MPRASRSTHESNGASDAKQKSPVHPGFFVGCDGSKMRLQWLRGSGATTDNIDWKCGTRGARLEGFYLSARSSIWAFVPNTEENDEREAGGMHLAVPHS